MKLSIQSDIVGKPAVVQQTDAAPHYFVNNHKVSLGYNWQNIECDFDAAFALITEEGYATSAELSSDNRKEEHFVSRQLCMVDIDNSMTLFQLLEDEFYNACGAGFYTTPSHTADNHRFRIIFMLEQPELDAARFRKITRGLLSMFQCADQSCKDATRLYYGTPNCKIKENRGNYLPNSAVAELIGMVDQQDEEYELSQQTEFQKYCKSLPPYPVTVVDRLLASIASRVGTLKGDYNQWLTIAWATSHTVGQHEARQLMMRHWPYKTKKESDALRSWRADRSPKVGTLIKLSGISQSELLEIETKHGYQRPPRHLGVEEAKRVLNHKIKIY